MQLIEWEVNEDGYEEEIIIPKVQRNLAAEEGIGTENKQKHHYPSPKPPWMDSGKNLRHNWIEPESCIRNYRKYQFW